MSQAHHVLKNDDYHFQHPNKQIYQEMSTFDEVLAAVSAKLG